MPLGHFLLLEVDLVSGVNPIDVPWMYHTLKEFVGVEKENLALRIFVVSEAIMMRIVLIFRLGSDGELCV